MELLLITILLLVILILIYQKLIAPLKYWRKRGVKYDRPSFFFGSFKEYIFKQSSLADYLFGLCVKYIDEPYFGIWTFTKPVLVLNDLQLIKEVGIKHSDIFDSHHMFSSGLKGHKFTTNLFSSSGEIWRKVRPALSPIFTSNKMKTMYQLVNGCAENFTKHYSNKSKNVVRVNVKDAIFSRFTIDAMCSCIFGLELNSFKDKRNEFFERTVEVSHYGGPMVYSLFAHCFSNWIVKLFKLSIVSADNQAFFENVAFKAIKMRKDSAIKRPDMIQILMEARNINETNASKILNILEESTQENNSCEPNKEQVEISDNAIVGNFLLFLIAGNDTSAMALTFLSYELAMNKRAQDKLLHEIYDYMERGNGSISFDDLSKMTYLDMVVTEILRLYPPLPFTDRVNNKDHLLKSGEKSILLAKNTAIWIPIFAIHRDPQYYINPNKFDPERFSVENRVNINKDAYMPFGIGPRTCIGSRFGILMIKSLLVNILPKFEFVPVESTPMPMELGKYEVFLNIENGLELGVKTREKHV